VFDVEPKKLARDYAKAGSVRALAEKYGVARSTLQTALKRHGIELRKRGQQRIAVPDKTLVADYKALRSSHAVARKHGVSQSAVYRALRRADDIEMEARGGKRKRLDDSKVLAAYERTESIRGVAADCGIDFKTARKALVRLGLMTKGE